MEISGSLGIFCKSSRLEISFEYKSISKQQNVLHLASVFSLNRSNQNPLRYHPSHPNFCRWTNSEGGTLWSFNLRLGWHVATWLGRHHEDPPWILLFLIESDFSTDVSLPEGTVQGISLCARKLGRLSHPKAEGFLQLTNLVVGLCYVELTQFQEFSGWTMRYAWCQPQTTLKTLGKEKKVESYGKHLCIRSWSTWTPFWLCQKSW